MSNCRQHHRNARFPSSASASRAETRSTAPVPSRRLPRTHRVAVATWCRSPSHTYHSVDDRKFRVPHLITCLRSLFNFQESCDFHTDPLWHLQHKNSPSLSLANAPCSTSGPSCTAPCPAAAAKKERETSCSHCTSHHRAAASRAVVSSDGSSSSSNFDFKCNRIIASAARSSNRKHLASAHQPIFAPTPSKQTQPHRTHLCSRSDDPPVIHRPPFPELASEITLSVFPSSKLMENPFRFDARVTHPRHSRSYPENPRQVVR